MPLFKRVLRVLCVPKSLAKSALKSFGRFCVLAFAFCAFCGSACLGEDSGGFVGVHYGYGEFRQVSSGTFGLGGVPKSRIKILQNCIKLTQNFTPPKTSRYKPNPTLKSISHCGTCTIEIQALPKCFRYALCAYERLDLGFYA